MSGTHSEKASSFRRLLREPTVHFFLLGALLLGAHRLVVGDPRVIVLTPALEADLLRRYHDQLNRAPTREEADAFLKTWKEEEALYREALREGIDRDDPTVRSVLVSKMRERALLGTRIPEPTQAELDAYLAAHRAEFEAPRLYEHEYVEFPKSEPDSAAKRDKALAALRAGATPASLGLRTTAANVDRARIERDFGPAFADQLEGLPQGQWQELAAGDRLLLVKLNGVQGGLPPPDVLHATLAAAWQAEQQKKALARATRSITTRYRFEEPPR